MNENLFPETEATEGTPSSETPYMPPANEGATESGEVFLDLTDFDEDGTEIYEPEETEEGPEKDKDKEYRRLSDKALARLIVLTVDAAVRAVAAHFLNKKFEGASDRDKKDLRDAWEAYLNTLPVHINPLIGLILANVAVYGPVFIPENPVKPEQESEPAPAVIIEPEKRRGRPKKTQNDT